MCKPNWPNNLQVTVNSIFSIVYLRKCNIMKSVFSIAFLIAFIFLNSCNSATTNTNTDSTKQVIDTTQTDSTSSVNNSQPNTTTETDYDGLTEYGKLVDIEDGVYPMYSVTVNFVERKFKQSFNINITEINISAEELYKLKNKYIRFNYTSELENLAEDIQLNSKSVLGNYAPAIDKTWKKVTGILNGADYESGDLPSNISVTIKTGEKIFFKFYVLPEVIAVNKKEVTIYYYTRGVNTITSIIQ